MLNKIVENQNKVYLVITAILFGLFVYLLFYRLGVHPFIDWDESIYGQVAKEAFQNNRWFDFTYFAKAWYEKPPLGMWLISASYAIAGINELSARIPSVLASVGIVIMSLRWVYEIRKSYLAVLLTMTAYFIMYPFLVNSYFVNLDTLIGFTTIIALYSWWKIFIADGTSGKAKRNYFLLWGAAIGLGVMIKSIVGFFPLVPIAIYMLTHRQFAFLKTKQFWYGVVLAAIIILPWHIYQSLTAGQAFWDNYFLYHVWQRYSTNLETNGQPFNFFIHLIYFRYYEATAVFGGTTLLGIYLAWRNHSVRYLVIGALALLLVFSISITKLPSYTTMILPLIVMLAGIGLAQLLTWIPQVWLKIMVGTVFVIAIVFTGYQFNTYKLAVGEAASEYSDHRDIGLFLNNFAPELPVYINNKDYRNLGIGFYSGRAVTPNLDPAIFTGATKEVFHRRSEGVFLGDGYILIKQQ